MKKIFIIIQREYLSRVRKKSFLVMTVLGPILMAALFIVPVFVAQITDEKKEIAIVDETGLFFNKIPNTENIHFTYLNCGINKAKEDFPKSKYNAILLIPDVVINSPNTVKMFSEKQVSLNVKIHIESALKKEIESMKLSASGINKDILQSIKTDVSLTTITMGDNGKEQRSYTEITMVLGYIAGFMIYLFIFLYGSQVMRGVIEEKTSRIVEVIVSSVKPFQLMMGKIIGVAMVGLTQFLLWITFTFIIVTFVQTSFPEKFSKKDNIPAFTTNAKLNTTSNLNTSANKVPSESVNEVLSALDSINFGVMICSFIFFFIGGYLLYSSLFAAIGAAVDNEADTQQFMMPITIPLIFAIIMAQFVINNPEGPISFWLSIIPLTSPIIMMIRIPFGVPVFEVILSCSLLIAGFIATTWLAAKIYRTGILMYGKKINYKELWKWLTYKS